MVNDYGVSKIATVARECYLAATRCKYRVSLASRDVDSQMLVFVGELLADDAHSRDHVRDSFQADFFVGRKPVVDTFEINTVLAGGDMRKAVALDDAVDLVGVVFEERFKNILDSVFHDPQRVKSREEFFVVCVLLYELRIVYTHLFVADKGLVDPCNVDNEQNEDDSDQDKTDMEQVKLLARYAVLF